MAAKGRLQLALERAKQRRDGEKVDIVEPTALPSAAERQSAIHAMPNFQEVPYDSELCAAHHVLVPENAGARAVGAAAYRMLRTRILQRTRSNEWNTIGVTSPGQGDGKSVTALNLALTIAREGNNNVFLIDLDMRSPKMCEYLGTAPPTEINDYLTGDAPVKDVLFSVGIENLTLAGTRTRTDQASELLASGRVEELFTYIRSVAPEPLIIVDLPPLLSTDDALIVAPKVDACLLVLAEGKSRRDGAAKALELLSEFKLAGIVLNRSRAVVKDYYSS
jgi:capsular exopolysaccharide synthesis family protein